MRKRKLCVIWIWDLLYDNARFQRWLARHRRHGWEARPGDDDQCCAVTVSRPQRAADILAGLRVVERDGREPSHHAAPSTRHAASAEIAWSSALTRSSSAACTLNQSSPPPGSSACSIPASTWAQRMRAKNSG